MMSAKAAAAVIRAHFGIFKGIFDVFLFFQTVQAIERQPKVVLMLGVRWVECVDMYICIHIYRFCELCIDV